MLPDREACRGLLEAAGCSRDVVAHVEAVAALASALADHAPWADAAVVQAGAMLHDLGRAWTQTSDHVPRGVAFLEEHGVDPRVVDAVARHMGAGVTEMERRVLGWPPGVYVPQTVEDRIVCHADNLTFAGRHVVLDDVVEKLASRDLPGVVERVRALHHLLAGELGVDPDDVSRSLG